VQLLALLLAPSASQRRWRGSAPVPAACEPSEQRELPPSLPYKFKRLAERRARASLGRRSSERASLDLGLLLRCSTPVNELQANFANRDAALRASVPQRRHCETSGAPCGTARRASPRRRALRLASHGAARALGGRARRRRQLQRRRSHAALTATCGVAQQRLDAPHALGAVARRGQQRRLPLAAASRRQPLPRRCATGLGASRDLRACAR